ncbi:MAG: DUF4350 domain-containing protein [Planctomycetota bacterium]
MKEIAGPGPIFKRKTIGWLIAVSSTTLIFGMLLGIFGTEVFDAPSIQSDSFSVSALGHHAFVEVLRQRSVTVIKSRAHSERKVNEQGVLVLAEPTLDDAADDDLERYDEALASDLPTLVVLRKYSGEQSLELENRRWIDRADWVPADATLAPLAGLLDDVQLVRPELDVIGAWSTSGLSYEPTLVTPQLITGSLKPIISCSAGVLLGELVDSAREAPLLVLADPGVIANYGIGRGENAELAIAIIDRLRGLDGNVVFDEVLHGHGHTPSVWREMFAFPMLLVTLQVLIGLAALLWSTMGRFGGLVPAPVAIAAGKEALVQNISELLLLGGHSADTARRYLRGTLRDVCEGLHLDATLADDALELRLAEISRVRQAEASYARMRAELAHLKPRGRQRLTALRVARAVYEWKQELLRATR